MHDGRIELCELWSRRMPRETVLLVKRWNWKWVSDAKKGKIIRMKGNTALEFLSISRGR
jgi:hypothetical protein